jgi:hypothetical protein
MSRIYPDLSLPRILCLHGASVNAQIFRIQCRAVIAQLGDKLRFVFADAYAEASDDQTVVAVFGEFAPFYRWLRWKPEHEELGSKTVSQKIIQQLTKAMEEDKGTGEWVGLLAFSQGGIVSAGLLWAQDHLEEEKRPLPGVNFRFAVVIASPGPVVHLDASGDLPKQRYLIPAGDRVDLFKDWPEEGATDDESHLITSPMLHVHGLQDPAIHSHRRLYKYSKKGSAKLIEWNGGHRMPIKPEDVERLVNGISMLAYQTNVDSFIDDW